MADAPDLPVDAFQGFVARYNLGGPSYTATTGVNAGVWTADNSVLDGICAGTPANGNMAAFDAPPGTTKINGTTDTTLFDKLILGDPIRCTVKALPNGNYSVRFLFAELFRGSSPCQGGAGTRRVTISLQGAEVATNLDLLAIGGGCAASTNAMNGSGQAFDRTFTTTVTNNQLAITIAKGTGTDFATVNAVELVQTK